MRPERDVLQFDPALSYGLVEYLRALAMLEEHGWPRRSSVPHGGHRFVVHIGAGLGTGGNEAYPGVFQPFGGFTDNIQLEEGHVRLPQAPGIGDEETSDLYDVLRTLA